MSTILNADYLLAVILTSRETVSFSELVTLGRQIEAEIPDAIVNVSRDSVNEALEHYPEIFKRVGNTVARGVYAKDYLDTQYRNEEFTDAIPGLIHRSVINILLERVIHARTNRTKWRAIFIGGAFDGQERLLDEYRPIIYADKPRHPRVARIVSNPVITRPPTTVDEYKVVATFKNSTLLIYSLYDFEETLERLWQNYNKEIQP